MEKKTGGHREIDNAKTYGKDGNKKGDRQCNVAEIEPCK
jgi:hypothetical protein